MSLSPPQKNANCDYRIFHNRTTAKKIARKYKTLTDEKSCPPIDAVFFTGGTLIKSGRYVGGAEVKNGYNTRYPLHTTGESDPVVGILIGVKQYAFNGDMHAAHALSAVKYRNTLFAFNAWGKGGKPVDVTIFETVRRMYNCKYMDMYLGPNVQMGDPYGICVGYASNFVLEMLVKIYQKQIPAIIYQRHYDKFVYTAMKTRGICFGSKCVKNMPNLNFFTGIRKNLFAKAEVSPPDLSSSSSLTVANLRKIGKNRGINLPSKLKKQEIVNALKRALLPSPPSPHPRRKLSNLDRVNFNESSPIFLNRVQEMLKPKPKSLSPPKPAPVPKPKSLSPPKPAPAPKKPKSPTMAELKAVAKNRGLKGYSKFTKKANLAKFINLY